MQAARRIKTPEELTAMSTALRVAEDGVAAALTELQPGTPVKTLAGAVLEAMAAGGVSTPATQDAAWVTSRDHPWQHGGDGGRVQSGDLVVLAAGALADGYVGEVARTWPAGDADTAAIRKLYERSNMVWQKLVAACRPGAATSDLLAAYDAANEPVPPMPVAYGLGLGFDPPVVTPVLSRSAAQERLDAGMVLAVTGYVWQEGVGAVLTRDAIHITDDGPVVLTASPSWTDSATRSVRPPAPASG
jgi:Xaa-Pro aminopeptidase